MSMVKINGINLNIKIQGEGEPLILIHGLGCDNTQWNTEIQKLSREFKTVLLDCRGHGKSDKPDSYTLNDHIQDILSIMDTFGFKTANLYGVSMGSYIAQGVAISQPHRIKKLILTVPKSNGLTSSTQRLIKEHTGELEGVNPSSDGMLCASLIPNATFIEMQYSGHIPMIEEPELYSNIINKFLSE
ncbi:alpha/beta fold hydrolase [Clostridium sp. FP1]|uniref:alpha/beta fold hydrolase n=1 Tax=Clostridium sp. FP1 TaxID=2724076 RepID=UPI0013E97BAA|nr:alpha/beta hydrolase [Clostridium sp. FP1]MBZ9636208.1 alpha/beta hydrolase [Clostridium sp. FP1]